jgi:fructokinase
VPEPLPILHPAVVTVIGEALIDLVPVGAPDRYQARPGGSPFNVAIGLARLGHRTALMARLADNAFGRLLREHAAAEGIDLSCAPHAKEPTTLAIVSMDAHAQASYDFYHQGTSDWQWSAAETSRLPAETAVLHIGSAASWTPPGDLHIQAAASRLRADGNVLISYDPNVRPALLEDPIRARTLIERTVATTHLVKASREDIDWLYPHTSVDQVAARWLGLGALMVIVTDGARGAHLMRAGSPALHRPGRQVAVADTVGAGDAFTAGMLGALIRAGLHTPGLLKSSPADALAAALDEAILVSAMTCERIGADPPVALPRHHVPVAAPLTSADLAFKELAELRPAP